MRWHPHGYGGRRRDPEQVKREGWREQGVLAVSADDVDLVARILGGQLSSALAAPPSPATAEVDRLATGALEHHLERRLRAPGVLHQG